MINRAQAIFTDPEVTCTDVLSARNTCQKMRIDRG
jgi:hypothetical protein